MTHEQRIEHLDSPIQFDVCQASANYVSKNFEEKKGLRDGNSQNCKGNGQRERGRNKKFGGRGRIHFQVCNKLGRGALKCYHRFNKGFKGPPPQQNQSQAFFNQH